MIINHKYKFIFLKTRKTAGTSIEIALSEFCGIDDIITPTMQEDEELREQLGFRGPQNYRISLRHYNVRDWLRLLRKRQYLNFYDHAPASFIRQHIGKQVWHEYFKFCFERNPFDKAISRYYWSTRSLEDRPDISAYLASAPTHFLSSWDTYTINDEISVDFLGRYESLIEDLATVSKKIGLSKLLTLPKAKTHYRQDRRHYSNVLSAQDRARIELICTKEIAAFCYGWQEVSSD